MKHGKKYVDSQKLFERNNLFDVAEAMDLVVKTGKAKFDETVEVHVRLGVDGRHADQQVRGAVVLPHGTGKTVRAAGVLPRSDKQQAALDAGADYVGADDLVAKIQRRLDGFRRRYCDSRYDGSWSAVSVRCSAPAA